MSEPQGGIAGDGVRTVSRGLVHHSDQGVQYASEEYLQVLRDHGMILRISRPGRPNDNARCESFLKTLKREEIYANDYRDLEHLAERMQEFIESYYNGYRPHSALGYRSPDEFEKQWEDRDAEFGSKAATIRLPCT